MLRNVQLGAKVKGAGNENLGKVKYLVAEPKDNTVTHLIVEKGLPGLNHQAVVEARQVKEVSQDGKTVYLILNHQEADQLPHFIERAYVGTVLPGSITLATFPGGVSTPISTDVYPVDEVAEQDLPSSSGYIETRNIPAYSFLIKEGAEVHAVDGKLGHIKRVDIDPKTEHIESFAIDHGFFSHEEYTVPIGLVESVSESSVILKVNKEFFFNSVPNRQDK